MMRRYLLKPPQIMVGFALALGVSGWLAWVGSQARAREEATRGLIQAVKRADPESVRKLLSEGADPNAGMEGRVEVSGARELLLSLLRPRPRYRGRSLLSRAAESGSTEIVRALLDAGARPNDGGDTRDRPLANAAGVGDIRSVELLLSRGAALNGPARDGGTALVIALQNGRVDVAHLLVRRGVDLTPKDVSGTDAFMLGSLRADKVTVAACLKAGIPLTETNRDGHTPLHYAAASKDAEVVRMLLDHGAPLEAVDRMGLTPLSWACRSGELATVRLLLEHGARPKAANVTGTLPQHFVVGRDLTPPADRIAMLEALHARGADLAAQDRFGTSVLHQAIWDGAPEVVAWLLQHSAPTEVRDGGGRTPLLAALTSSRAETACVRLLLAKGANIEAQDNQQNSALLMAVRQAAVIHTSARLENARLLLQRGASVHKQNVLGESPLSAARHLKASLPAEIFTMIEQAATKQSGRDSGHNGRESRNSKRQ